MRWLSEVFSFGDLIVACGLANLGFRVFFPLRETATYYDEASEYDQYRDLTNRILSRDINPMTQHGPRLARRTFHQLASHLHALNRASQR